MSNTRFNLVLSLSACLGAVAAFYLVGRLTCGLALLPIFQGEPDDLSKAIAQSLEQSPGSWELDQPTAFGNPVLKMKKDGYIIRLYNQNIFFADRISITYWGGTDYQDLNDLHESVHALFFKRVAELQGAAKEQQRRLKEKAETAAGDFLKESFGKKVEAEPQ